MNIYEKLHALRMEVGELHKDAESYGYSYVSGSQILSKLEPILNDLRLIIIPSAIPESTDVYDYTNDKGTQKRDFIVKGHMEYRIINIENPEEIIRVPWAYYGQQNDISKAFGSALTYSERYFWLKLLSLPTDSDDPDAMDTGNKQHRKETKTETKRETKKDTGDKSIYISDAQAKRFYALAQGNKELITNVLEPKGISDISKIPWKIYKDLCSELESKRSE